MIINGFQKLTLLDFPGKTAAIIFAAGCDFRCPFCHNAPLVSRIRFDERIDEAEILEYLKKRQGLLDGVVLSGGEPLLQKDALDFLAKIKELGYSIKLDTNGTSPQKLRLAVEGGLVDYVAMDIKNSPELYGKTVGLSDFDTSAVCESKNFLLEGHVDYEFRTTVTHELHTPKSILEAARWISGAKRYFLQNFKDSGDLVGEGMSACTDAELSEMKTAASTFISEVFVR